MQTLSRLLKTNGFAYVLFDTQNLNKDQLQYQNSFYKDVKIIT